MRVTEEMASRMVRHYVLGNKESVYRLQEQVSSGKRVKYASDDPSSFSLIERLRNSASSIDQYKLNADRLLARMQNMDNKMRQVAEILQRTSEIIVDSSDSTSLQYQQVYADEVDQMLEDMVRIGNSTYNGEHIFAGLRSDVAPYEVTRDANGKITDVTYRGSTETRMVEIGEGLYVPAGIPGSAPGSAVFQTEEVNFFADLIHLRDRLLAGENPSATETTTVDAATDIFTVTRDYQTGAAVRVSALGNVPGGLDPDRDYYAIRVSDTEIRLADTRADAMAGTFIDITDSGTGELNIAQQSLATATLNLDHLLSVLGQVGAFEERIEFNQKILSTASGTTLETLDSEESLDVAKAVSDLAVKNMAYEASLRITSSMLEQSLLYYI